MGLLPTFRSLVADRRGSTAIEYCLIAGSIALVIVVSLTAIGTKINHFFQQIGNAA